MSAYYADKQDLLKDLFGTDDVQLRDDGLSVDGRFLPIVEDVIVAVDAARLPPNVAARLHRAPDTLPTNAPFAAEIQSGFGEEWTSHPEILPEHEEEFRAYFDLVDLSTLGDLRIADLGCGIGRWSHFLAPRCRNIVLVDFSEAIFVARRNLACADNAVFVLADILDLPFREGAFDLSVCLGVLHHLPIDALAALRRLAPLAPRHLAYLYYALDNRPIYFRWLLAAATACRRALQLVRTPSARARWTWVIAIVVYAPVARLGPLLARLRLQRFVPLAETYSGKSLARLRQDAYDRFFTAIEQRFSRDEILQLSDTFARVDVSERIPYWHFLCVARIDS